MWSYRENGDSINFTETTWELLYHSYEPYTEWWNLVHAYFLRYSQGHVILADFGDSTDLAENWSMTPIIDYKNLVEIPILVQKPKRRKLSFYVNFACEVIKKMATLPILMKFWENLPTMTVKLTQEGHIWSKLSFHDNHDNHDLNRTGGDAHHLAIFWVRDLKFFSKTSPRYPPAYPEIRIAKKIFPSLIIMIFRKSSFTLWPPLFRHFRKTGLEITVRNSGSNTLAAS